MVFESVVADLLNRFLGDFVDSLDASQLNIGIWSGNIRLLFFLLFYWFKRLFRSFEKAI